MTKNSQSTGWDDYLGEELPDTRLVRWGKSALLVLCVLVAIVPWTLSFILLLVFDAKWPLSILKWFDRVAAKIIKL
jgi:hypothetical protein